jgi:Protein of unknown function (DUF2971)
MADNAPSSKQPSPLLWHYTSFKGLHGIVTEGKLIASSLAYLNDTEEFLYTINPLLEHLDTMGPTLGDLVIGVFPKSVPSMVKAVFRQYRGQALYVTCFSKEPDDLSQWRSYTPRPPGFAIGFQPDELEPLANSQEFTMMECRYPTHDQLLAKVKETVEAATVGMKEDKQKLPKPPSGQAIDEFIDRWAFKIVTAIIALAPQNKHPCFAAEKEVRLLGRAEKLTVEYRVSGSLVVPYVKIAARPKEGPSPIKVILVGPCPHQDAVIAVTRQMCVQHEVRPTVLPSAIPYRNW